MIGSEGLMGKKFDAFLSHNSKDKPIVELIAEWLEDKASLSVWLDKWNLVPGDPWQEEIENALDESKCCVVILGPNGIGPWQNEELRSALEERVSKQTIRVLPVLLPGASRPREESKIPRFLRRLSWVVFRNKWNEEDALRRLSCGINGIPPGRIRKKNKTDICPFRGLEVFREQDKEFFFGREAVVQRLMDRLKTDRFLLILGPSGCGKSSVVQAGLIPHLREQSLVILITPREHPIEELALALRKIYPKNEMPLLEKLIDRLTESCDNLHYISREVIEGTHKKNLVLVIDQFEELFTQTDAEEERSVFVMSLLNSVEAHNGPVIVILTMRSDFIGKCAFYPDLNTYVSEHFFQVEPMSIEELKSIMEEPVHMVGLQFEAGVVERILADVKDAPGELPLLEHALLELYEMREGAKLLAQAYDEIGGIAGALVNRAESEFTKLNDEEKKILRKMFVMRLIQPGEGTEDTRRIASKEELLAIGGGVKAVENVINRWIDARLLTSTHDISRGQALIDVAHEALIRKWNRIKNWMEEDREAARLTGILRNATLEWKRSNESSDYLFVGARLVQIEALLKSHAENLTNAEIQFVNASIKWREELEKKELKAVYELAAVKIKAVKRSRVIIFIVLIALISLIYLTFNLKVAENNAQINEEEAKIQLAMNYWENSRIARNKGDKLYSMHLAAEAIEVNPIPELHKALLLNIAEYWNCFTLIKDFPQKEFFHYAIFIENGTKILTWNKDQTARFYDASTGQQIGEDFVLQSSIWKSLFNTYIKRVFIQRDDITPNPLSVNTLHHKGSFQNASFNADATKILTWSSDRKAQLWDTISGEQIGQPLQHRDSIQGASFNSDGTKVITWSDDHTARLWDTNTGKQIGPVFPHQCKIDGATLSVTGLKIFTWCTDDTVHFWDVKSGKHIIPTLKFDDDSFLGGIADIAFNADETRVVVWGWFKNAFILDVDTCKNIGPGLEHKEMLEGAIFSTDGTRVLTWSMDGTARFWGANTGQSIGQILQHEDKVRGASFYGNGTKVITWSDDHTARLWDYNTGKQIGQTLKHQGVVYAAILNEDETKILTWSHDKTVRLWDANTGEQVGLTLQHRQSVEFGLLNRSGTRILSWCANTARLWDARTKQTIELLLEHEGMVKGAIFNHDETWILTWSSDGTARVWDSDSGKQILPSLKHWGDIKTTIFNTDETKILTWSGDTARIWDATTGKQIGPKLTQNYNISGLRFSNSKAKVLTWSKDEKAQLWHGNTGKQIGPALEHKGEVWGAEFNADESKVLIRSNDCRVRLWNTKTYKQIGKDLLHGDEVNGAIFNRDGTMVLTWSDDKTARIWDAKTCKQIGIDLLHQDEVNGAIFIRDGAVVLTWSDDKTVRLWDAKTCKQIGPALEHKEKVYKVILNSDESKILTHCSFYDEYLSLWDIRTHDLIWSVPIHELDVKGITFNGDESMILTWSSDNTARLWNANTGRPIGNAMRHKDGINGASFNKDETMILTWSDDYTARLWDTKTGRQIGADLQHKDEVNGAIFNSSETKILTWSRDGTARIWDIGVDLDFPKSKIKLQVQALTGVKLNTNNMEIEVIGHDKWIKIKKEYLEFIKKHYKSCKYPQYDVYHKLFPEDVK